MQRRPRRLVSTRSIEKAADECPAEELDAEHPLLRAVHERLDREAEGRAAHDRRLPDRRVSATHRYVFDLQPDEDVYWCAADVGWVTGHSYIVYGPLCNGATCVMYEGAPDYPHQGIWWELARALRRDDLLHRADGDPRLHEVGRRARREARSLDSLRLLGTVGEPINPKAWLWYYKVIGGERCPIVDTWWQTETGAIMITPLPGIVATKPGSATRPFPGIAADVVDEREGKPIDDGQGLLVLTASVAVDAAHALQGGRPVRRDVLRKFGKETYLVGDAARKDKDGYFWVIGRIDDVVNVSGHRLSTAEVESAIVSHQKVAEAAVIGQADEDTGQAICAFVTLEGDARRLRRAGRGDPRPRRRSDRQVRAAQADHLGRRPAQDPLGQDHAAPAARHRRRPRARRRDHAARPDVMAQLEDKINEEHAADEA